MSAKHVVLLSCLGLNDPLTGEDEDGPMVNLFTSFVKEGQPVDKVVLLIAPPNETEQERAREVTRRLKQRREGVKVEVRPLPVDDPHVNDEKEVYHRMKEALQVIADDEPRGTNFLVGRDSGTPAMQSAWLLLTQSGLFPARLFRGVPAKYSSSGKWERVEMQFDDPAFPTLAHIQAYERYIAEMKRPWPPGEIPPPPRPEYIAGKSPALLRAMREAERATRYDCIVLLLGEPGTGKNLVARSIHEHSTRKDGPFKTINCASIPENLLESELFGTSRGAFTGAVDRKGIIEEAHGGTFFLDEIGELPQSQQAKMLHFVETREISRVGSNKVISVDCRLIAATNQNLDAKVAEGAFRQDLYSRLQVYPITMPPLREMKGDIALLAQHFLEELNGRYGEQKELSREALRVLTAYWWPNNIRELRSVIENAYIRSEDKTLGAEDLPGWIKYGAPTGTGQSASISAQKGVNEADLWKQLTQFLRGSFELLNVFGSQPQNAETLKKKMASCLVKAVKDQNLGLTQESIAKKIGVNKSYMSQLLRLHSDITGGSS